MTFYIPLLDILKMRIIVMSGITIIKPRKTEQIPLKEVLDLFGQNPEFGDKRSKTRWIFFMKGLEK
ncbi:hypothetical protein FG051_02380 [Companilactobacillus futsaii]|uniref:Uncharacterized protein n=2 Tax=Companilactobacillus futsaii TaxID=938155 RepID=A0A5B7T0A8_9LACO|nr:hypothetical protein FG051_02380 [Companilactobacillus futsaii]